jgi:hypothetical protein
MYIVTDVSKQRVAFLSLQSLKKSATGSFETSAATYPETQRHIPECLNTNINPDTNGFFQITCV